MDILIRGGTLVGAPGRDGRVADVRLRDGRVAEIGSGLATTGQVLDATGAVVSPGLIQTHVHLCQTAFRGLAEDLDVMAWLDRWIWPLEQRLDARRMAVSARWGVADLLLSGTTTFLSMETVHHTDEAIRAAGELGARAFVGKALMDREEPGTVLLGETPQQARTEVERLLRTWHGSYDDRIRVALSPRAPSASTAPTWAWVAETARREGLVIHTHANENRGQSERVAGANQARDVEVLERYGALGPRTVLAHGVWLDDDEVALLARRGATVAHCPTANLKLGSGIADIPRLLAAGVNVGLGIDAAACNNSLSALRETRLAAVLHRGRGDAGVLGAREAFAMATTGGARALGIDAGRLEVGALADVAVFEAPDHDPGSDRVLTDLVFGDDPGTARHVVVDGRPVVIDRRLVYGDAVRIRSDGRHLRAELSAELGAVPH